MSKTHLSPFLEVLDAFRRGEVVLMVDREDREDEADLVVATERLTAEHVSFMMYQARGLICVSLGVDSAERLNLPLQALNSSATHQTAFTLSVDHCSVSGCGATASARCTTMQRLIDPDAKAGDFVTPGHVFPLVADPAGVIGRAGHTEGSYDLARLAGFSPSGVICEVLTESGKMARGAVLEEFAKRHSLKVTSVSSIISHRIHEEVLVREVACSKVQTDFGEFLAYVFEDDLDGREHLALVLGEEEISRSGFAPLVRIHSECLTGDVFGSQRCDCRGQLEISMQRVVEEGVGVILYLRQEGRGIGLGNKLKAYALQDEGHDTVEANLKLGFPADQRNFAAAARMLGLLGIGEVRLLTNNPLKLNELAAFGIKVKERVPVVVPATDYSKAYLAAKREKLGHLL